MVPTELKGGSVTAPPTSQSPPAWAVFSPKPATPGGEAIKAPAPRSSGPPLLEPPILRVRRRRREGAQVAGPACAGSSPGLLGRAPCRTSAADRRLQAAGTLGIIRSPESSKANSG